MLPHELWLARATLDKSLSEDNSPPIAARWMEHFGLAPREGLWFVMQPVHIHIARDHLVLTDLRQLMLTDQESKVLFEIAKTLFEEVGKQAIYGSANTWFLRADDWKDLKTSTPDAASGHNIDLWMPAGPQARDWRKVQNEVQMHWFSHPVNDLRDSRRMQPVNSLWLWGGGISNTADQGRFTEAFNLPGWTQALLPESDSRKVVTSVEGLIQQKPGEALLVLDALLGPALQNDWGNWLSAMQTLEETWFAPLLDALKSGTIDALSLVTTNDSCVSRFTASRLSLRKFWVKPTLATLCP